jgi:hypothetical protein
MNFIEEGSKLRIIANGYKAQYELCEDAEDVDTKQKYDWLYTSYELFADALENPKIGCMQTLVGWMKKAKPNLPESDVVRLRGVFHEMKKDLDFVMKAELGAKKIEVTNE